MDWLKKKKEEAKQAASQAAAKMQNKRSAFKGEGNVLGGGNGSGSSDRGSSGETSGATAASATASATASSSAQATSASTSASSSSSTSSRAFKVPSFGKRANEPTPLSDDEKREQRDARKCKSDHVADARAANARLTTQLRALEERSGAWDKRVATARKARLQNEAALETKLESTEASDANTVADATAAAAPLRVLSVDEMRAFELQSAHASVGFNPYAVVMATSTQASTAMHGIAGPQSMAPMPPPPPPSTVSRPSPVRAPSVAAGSTTTTMDDAASTHVDAALPSPDSPGGVFVLLRQAPAVAIPAAETILKMLGNILQHPQDDKFRRLRVANPTIQTKLVAVRGAVELLTEAGFAPLDIDGEQFLVLATSAFDAARVQAVRDRTEVALTQLQVDSMAI